MTFAEFMEACLYHPKHGYYTRPEPRKSSGRAGDYYTSVDVHPIFGRLLARQLAEMWERLGRPAEFRAVECGAGEGRLAQDILEFAARALPEFHSALRYVAVERSAARRGQWKAGAGKGAEIPDSPWPIPEEGQTATRDAKGRMQEEMPERIPAGCIFSNELLDALPVHRVKQTRHGLREIFVGWEGQRFTDVEGEPSTERLAQYFAGQGITLPREAQAEVSLAACAWMEQAGRALERGYVLTIDYGLEARELYNERHMRGTLLAYHQHRASEDYYARPGEQDLTAHVNFTALEAWGRRAGLQRIGLASQGHFLLALGQRNEFADLYEEGMSEAERTRARLSLKRLIHPEGMGERFSVLAQGKGVEGAELTGYRPLTSDR
jgi:SAM-dependent MidA family methyltransferase